MCYLVAKTCFTREDSSESSDLISVTSREDVIFPRARHGGDELFGPSGSPFHQSTTTCRVDGTSITRDKPVIEVLNEECIKDLVIREAGAHAFELLPVVEQGLTNRLGDLVYRFPYSCSS